MTESEHDRLDDLANRFFPGRVVRKDLVRQVKVGASVPVYVLEFLLVVTRVSFVAVVGWGGMSI